MSGGVEVRLAAAVERGVWDVGDDVGRIVRARARLWLAAVAVGIAGDSLRATLDYTTERMVFGRPVAHHQGNAFQLAGLATDVHGARLAVRDAAAALDRGEADAAFWATQAWLTAIDTARATTDAGIQLLGGHGFVMDHLAEKRFREARMLGLLAGGRDTAIDDLADVALDVTNPLQNRGDRAPAG